MGLGRVKLLELVMKRKEGRKKRTGSGGWGSLFITQMYIGEHKH